MKFLSTFVSAAALGAACVSAAPQEARPGRPPVTSISGSNPFAGHTFFVSPVYREQIQKEILSLRRKREFELARKAAVIAQTSTFLWLDSFAAIPNIRGWLQEASNIQRITKKKQAVQIVVYNLPNRDCSAKASAGELEVANGGEERYKDFINEIVKELKRFPDVRVVLQLETDAIGNLVTGLSNPKCAEGADVQKRSLGYAIAHLQLPNVAIYLDGAHAGWLGWESNIGPAANVLAEIIALAKEINPNATVRGVATNVSNYNGLGNQEQFGYDELVYVRNLAPLLAAHGWNAHFIVDQGRSGNQNVTRSGGDWCNNKFAGFGPRPTTQTPDALVDAIVWVKPGGQADGTSDVTAARYDEACGSETSLIPAPEAGTWFPEYFAQLLTNANPPL